jgi:predicted CoA-binding protein
LVDTKTIAMIGASAKPERASNRVMLYLQQAGYRVIPVNPGLEGQELFGETAYASLANIPVHIDMIDVFRRVDAIPGIVDELLSLAVAKGIRYLWLQLDIYDEESATRARDAGLTVVMDRCPKIEHSRLMTAG